MRKIIFLILSGFIILCSCKETEKEKNVDISINISEEVKSLVKSEGRLFMFFTKNANGEPRFQLFPNPINAPYIYAVNLDHINGENFKLDHLTEWVSSSDFLLTDLPEDDYVIQVLWDQDTSESKINAPGNIYSQPKEITYRKGDKIEFTIDQVIPERQLIEHEQVREITYKSDTLSQFWGKPMELKASLLLPRNYNKEKAYPIRYNIAGYGGRYTRVEYVINDQDFMTWWNSEEAPEIINVYLDGEGPFGDSYQMDSENSGPYGYSLIYELIPFIEKKYRNTLDPKTRFVDGCSTGGWVSLGLQLYYPDHFNGVFSYSPDAVEFENYQLSNIYKDKNVFTNEFGYERPCMRSTDGEPMVSMKKFIDFENVQGSSNTYLNSGDQFSAHTALYSPKGEDNLPKPLFDPITGEIDHSVAEHWKKYDFKIYAEKNWSTLGPKLQGKIYVWMGDMDHFYLNMATRAFDDYLESTTNPKSDAIIEFSATEGHCSRFNNRVVLEQIKERLTQIDY